jgi:hypothetical protein
MSETTDDLIGMGPEPRVSDKKLPAPASTSTPPLWLLPTPPEAMHETDLEQITDALSYALEAIAKRWIASAGRRGKNRESELVDVPPASMRTMAAVLKVYGKQLAATAHPTAVRAAMEAEIAEQRRAVTSTPASAPDAPVVAMTGEWADAAPVEMGGRDPFGSLPWLALPPAVDDDDDPQANGALPWLPLPPAVEDDVDSSTAVLQPGEPAYGGHYAPGTEPVAGDADPKA